MPSRVFVLTSIIEEWNEKLNNIVDKYLGDPVIGFVIFVGLFIFGFLAITSFSQK